MTPLDWSLAEHTRQTVEDSPIADPHLLARKVALTIPDDRLRDAVDEMIGGYVVSLVTRSRWNLPTGHRVCDSQGSAAGGELSAADAQRTHDTQKVVSVSRKPAWGDIAHAYKRWLDQRLGVEDGWKFLRDFTRDDCTWAASDRNERAQRLLYRAEQFAQLARALEEHDRPTVGDLPGDVLTEVFG